MITGGLPLKTLKNGGKLFRNGDDQTSPGVSEYFRRKRGAHPQAGILSCMSGGSHWSPK